VIVSTLADETRLMTMEEAVLSCRFSAVVSHRGVFAILING
jgi:hypothetical protein